MEPESCRVADNGVDANAKVGRGSEESNSRVLFAEVGEEGAYEILESDWRDEEVIRGLDRCQAAFVADHGLLYENVLPSSVRDQWFNALSCGSLREYMRAGIVVLHARKRGSRQVVGYISCSRVFGTLAVEEPSDSQSVAANSASASNSGGTAEVGAQAPYGKINHVVVLPVHREKGIARGLFEALLHLLRSGGGLGGIARSSYGSADVAGDLRLTVAELNEQAWAWYARLGFRVVELYADRFRVHGECRSIVYLKMQRLERGGEVKISSNCSNLLFRDEVCGEWATLLTEPRETVVALREDILVLSFDAHQGLHLLSDGRRFDMVNAFAAGRVRFRRPLHSILQKDDPCDDEYVEVSSGSRSSREGDSAVVIDDDAGIGEQVAEREACAGVAQVRRRIRRRVWIPASQEGPCAATVDSPSISPLNASGVAVAVAVAPTRSRNPSS